jgi:hypothetical protein
MMAGPLKYTTRITATETARECIALLDDHGAEMVALRSEGKGMPTSLTFQITTRWGPRQYQVAANTAGVAVLLKQAHARGDLARVAGGGLTITRMLSGEHARNVAWRVLHDWLQVQLAMVHAGVAELERIMLPWQLVSPGKDMFELVNEQEGQLALEAAGDR